MKEKNDYNNLDYKNEENSEYERMEREEDNYGNGGDEQSQEHKLEIGMDDFKNMDEEHRDYQSKLNFFNVSKAGGLNNIETGSEVYLTDMLVFFCIYFRF